MRRISILGLAIGLLFCAAPALADTAPNWLEGQRIEPGEAAIAGVSCSRPTTCLAASAEPIVQDDALSYEPATDPDPSSTLNAVSCAPSTHFCMFVDSNGGAFTYSNGTFGALTNIDGNTELESVSCTSSTFCMAIDHNDKVFKYTGSWDSGTSLTQPSNFGNITNVSCVPTFCVALASSSGGEKYSTWSGSTWTSSATLFDASGSYAVSLTCTSSSFCLMTDNIGYSSVFGGSSWSAAVRPSATKLYSSCVGTSCVAVDLNDNAYSSSNGTTWAPNSPANIHAGTSIGAVSGVSCATATLCVAVDIGGDATTYAAPPNVGTPTLSGTPTVGQALSLAHAPIAEAPDVWYYDDWRRCDNPDAGCTLSPISNSATGYTLTGDDAGEYLDVRETLGFGFDEETQRLSNIVGPIDGGSTGSTGDTGSTGSTGSSGGTGSNGSTNGTDSSGGGDTSSGGNSSSHGAGTAKLAGTVTTSSGGVLTIPLSCPAGSCHGTLTLTAAGSLLRAVKQVSIGSASYTIAAGKTKKIKLTLTARGKRALKKHKHKLAVTLTIKPAGGKPSSHKLTIKSH